MTATWRRLAFSLIDAIALALGFATALLMLAAPVGMPWRALWPLAAALLCAPVSVAPKRARIPLALMLAALSGLAGYRLLPLTGIAHIGFTALCAAIPLVTLPLIAGERMTTVHLMLLAFQLAASLLTLQQELAIAHAPATFIGCIQLLLFLFHQNVSQLRERCGAQYRAMLPGNLGMTALMAALILLAANVRDIWEAIKEGALRLIAWIISLLNAGLIQSPNAGGAGGEAGGMPPLEEGKTSLFWKILEYVAYALAAALILYLLYRAIRALPALYRRLSALLRKLLARYRSAVNADYTDETEPLPEADARKANADSAFDRFRRRFARPPSWQTLTNRQRVREAYRRLSQRAQPQPSLTAREALTGPIEAPQLTDAYDRARYSAHPITDAEAAQAKAALKGRG